MAAREEPERAHDQPLRLFRSLHAPLFAAPVRIVLAGVALLSAFAVGIQTGPALLGFGAGTFGTTVLLLSDRRYALRALAEIVPVPPEAEYESPGRTALAALLPSTVGTAMLAAAALALSTALTVFLGGILAGMAVAGLLGAAQVAAWERRRGGRLYVDRNTGRRYVRRLEVNSDRARAVARR